MYVCYQIIFEGTIGGPEGDAAIDDVKFTRDNNCSLIPDIARPAFGGTVKHRASASEFL